MGVPNNDAFPWVASARIYSVGLLSPFGRYAQPLTGVVRITDMILKFSCLTGDDDSLRVAFWHRDIGSVHLIYGNFLVRHIRIELAPRRMASRPNVRPARSPVLIEPVTSAYEPGNAQADVWLLLMLSMAPLRLDNFTLTKFKCATFLAFECSNHRARAKSRDMDAGYTYPVWLTVQA